MAAQYASGFELLTTQCVPALLDAVGCESGTRLLDVATGPGHVLLSALERGALCAGIDFSSSMLALAQRNIDAASQARKAAGAEVCNPRLS